MNPESLDSLTVVELKKELTARNQPTTGRKKDLVDRLKEYLLANESASAPSNNLSHSTSQSVDEAPSEVDAPDTAKQEAASSAAAETQSDVSTEGKVSIDNNSNPDHSHAGVRTTVVSSDGEHKNDSKSHEAKSEAINATEADANGAKEVISTDTPKIIDLRKKRRISSDLTNTIHVANFMRPLTVPAVKDLLKQKGQIIESSFWMDQIKSQCVVSYETDSEAEAAFEFLDGLKWPSHNQKTLKVTFLNEEDAKKIVAAPNGAVPYQAKAATGAVIQISEPATSHSNEGKHENKRSRSDIAEKVEENLKEQAEPSLSQSAEPPTLKLDTLFKKTTAIPPIYWLPVAEEVVSSRKSQIKSSI